MTTNQEGRQAAIRDSTSTAYGVAADWHALFDDAGIGAGTFNERLLAWINAELSASHSNLVSAMQAYAEDAGYDGWEDMATLVLAMNGAETLLDGETQGLAFDFTDQSALIIDTGTPANNYDSTGIVSSGSLVGPSGKLTYTSPSNKLTLQSDGVMRYQAHNLVVQSADLSTSWTIERLSSYAATNEVTAPLGDVAFKVIEDSTAANTHRFRQSVTCPVGALYTLSVCVKALATGSSRKLFLDMSDNATGDAAAVFDISTGSADSATQGGSWTEASSAIEDLGNGWYKCSVTARRGAGTQILTIFHLRDGANTSYNGDGSSGLYFCAPHLYRYPANTDYIRTTSAAKYALPLEYSATDGSCLGLLVEEQRTNLLLGSGDTDNAAYWNLSSIATSTANGPDGVSASATTIEAQASGAGSRHLAESTLTAAAYTFSVYAKAGTTEFIILRAAFFTTNFQVGFNLSTGVADTGGVIKDVGNGWYRCSVTWTPGGADVAGFLYMYPANSLSSITSDIGDSVTIWGPQLELGSFPTSPILTYGAAATRNVDNVSIATSAFPYSATANSIFVESVCSESSAAKVIEIAAPSRADALVNIRNSSAEAGLIITGAAFSSQAAIPIAAGTAGTVNKLAASYEDNDMRFAKDGTLGSQDTSGTAQQTAHSKVQIGATTAPGEVFNSVIRKIAILPRSKTNAELQAETA